MLQTNLTHYWPWTDPDDVAWCGAALDDVRQHSLTPSCPACARRLAIEDAVEARLDEEAVLPFTDADAIEAGVALPRADLFAFAAQLTRAYAQAVTADQRRGRKIGGRR